jgi:predicted nucleic acid-binding protein
VIILDSNVISALMREEAPVVTWLDRQPETSIWITSVTLFEIRFGLDVMPLGRRRSLLAQVFETTLDEIEYRIAVFDWAAALETASLAGERQRRGEPRDLRDTMIAGIALAHHATLATRNTSHFADLTVPVVNPWSA